MTRSLSPRILSRPSPWITLAILLLIAAVATLASGSTPVSAVTTTKDYLPQSSSTSSPNCYEWEANKQSLGGAVARCEGPAGGEVVYQFDPTGIPANATDIKYSAFFLGLSGGGPGQVEVFIAPAGASFTVSNTSALTTTETWKSTASQTWGHSWTPSTNAQVKMKWKSGEKVYWDALTLAVSYTTPDQADLTVTASGPASVLEGSVVSYTVVIHNNGPQTATGAILTTNYPAGIVALSSSGCQNGGSGAPTCQLGNINADGTKIVTLNALAAYNSLGLKSSMFTASSNVNDPVWVNSIDNHGVTVVGRRDITLCKTWQENGDGTVEPAKTFTFHVTFASGKPAFDVMRTVAEGGTHCATFGTFDETVSIQELPTPGFQHIGNNLSPQWHMTGNGQIGGLGSTAVMNTNLTAITFTNQAVWVDAEDQNLDHVFKLCKTVDPNGDANTDSGIFEFDVRVQGGATVLDNYPMNVSEGVSSCANFTFEQYNIDPTATIEVEEVAVSAGWVHAPNYPQHTKTGSGLATGFVETFQFAPGEFEGNVHFHNKTEPVALPNDFVMVCKQLEDNNDGVSHGGSWEFDFHVQGNPVSFESVYMTVNEGETHCTTIDMANYAVAAPATLLITESASGPFSNAAGYPKWMTNGNIVTGATAIVNYTGSGPVGPRVDFINREAAAGAPNPTPSPTPAPTGTPTNTPVPPTSTPAIPQQGEPEPIPTSTPTASSTPSIPSTPSVPGNGGGENATPPSGSTPVGQPSPSEPATIETGGVTSSDPVVGQPTPIAPSTGNVAGEPRSATNAGLAMIFLGLAAVSGSLGLAQVARRRVANDE